MGDISFKEKVPLLTICHVGPLNKFLKNVKPYDEIHTNLVGFSKKI